MGDRLTLRLTRLSALVEFSLRSLDQPYGHAFFRRVALRHPIRLLRALREYWMALGRQQPAERTLLRHDEREFVDLAASAAERFLVATGFCQKPFSCPAGRFNHDCVYLTQWTPDSVTPFPLACSDCSIRFLGRAALSAGASFAILTSALDIANDVLLPSLEERRFTHAMMAICPYSVEPMSLALLSSGIEGFIMAYELGSCANYSQWLRADGGDKPERTALSPQVTDRMLRLLRRVGDLRCREGCHAAQGYVQAGHVYRPYHTTSF